MLLPYFTQTYLNLGRKIRFILWIIYSCGLYILNLHVDSRRQVGAKVAVGCITNNVLVADVPITTVQVKIKSSQQSIIIARCRLPYIILLANANRPYLTLGTAERDRRESYVLSCAECMTIPNLGRQCTLRLFITYLSIINPDDDYGGVILKVDG